MTHWCKVSLDWTPATYVWPPVGYCFPFPSFHLCHVCPPTRHPLTMTQFQLFSDCNWLPVGSSNFSTFSNYMYGSMRDKMQKFLSMPRPVLDATLYHHLCAEPLLEFLPVWQKIYILLQLDVVIQPLRSLTAGNRHLHILTTCSQ